MNPSLLIVVPTLNSHLLLPRLLRSLQAQTWEYWRLLFIDGPSCLEHRQWLVQCCASEPRCRWLEEDPVESGIFGAMNQGFAQAAPTDWLLFWGSDDWAAGPHVLANSMNVIATASRSLDLLVCRGRYVQASTGLLLRPAFFHSEGLLTAASYRRALILGSTPPHQATLIGPSAQRSLACYSHEFRLSADLDYFLQLSRYDTLTVQCLDIELVHMGNAGISGQYTMCRLQEVRHAYSRCFGGIWFLPFIARYAQRLISLVRIF